MYFEKGIFKSMNDDNTQNNNIHLLFKPRTNLTNVINNKLRYIMVEFGYNHYNLVTYNDNANFIFNDLPEEIKCLLKNQTPNLTRDVIEFKACSQI